MSTGVKAARNLMRRSREEHFAVGAFNVENQETLLAITGAAQAKKAPVLVEVSHGEVAIIGLANMRSLVDNYRAEFGVDNLDRSPSVEVATAGIDAGLEFIHIDYSQAEHDATDAPTPAARWSRASPITSGQLQRPHRGHRLRRGPQDVFHSGERLGVRRRDWHRYVRRRRRKPPRPLPRP